MCVRSPRLLRVVLDRLGEEDRSNLRKIRLCEGSNSNDDHERIRSSVVPTFAITTTGARGTERGTTLTQHLVSADTRKCDTVSERSAASALSGPARATQVADSCGA